MNSLQEPSIKIKKKTRNTKTGERSYICGGCQRAYKSYPALYLHIKRKHNGVRPPNTKASKPVGPVSSEKTHTGRPQKPSHDVDDISQRDVYLEDIQSELLGFLGEKLNAVCTMDSKPKLENVVLGVLGISDDIQNDWFTQIKQRTSEFFNELKAQAPNNQHIELDFEEFRSLPLEDPLKIVVWFVLWLGKYIVKPDFIQDLCLIFANIWKVLDQKQLQIQDLDNKLVWNEVIKECEPIKPKLGYFDGNNDLIYEFIKKTCHLIGRYFE
jgi:hypothetical protein